MQAQIVALARQIVAMKAENCEQEAMPYGYFDQD